MIAQWRYGSEQGRGAASRPRPEFDTFLFAPIGDDGNDNGMQLSVLSALARQGTDPWEEAGRLAGLPDETATRELTALIAALPAGAAARPDAVVTAARLIALLPPPPRDPVLDRGRGARSSSCDVTPAPRPWLTEQVIVYVISVAFMLAAQWFVINRLVLAQKGSAALSGQALTPTPSPRSGPARPAQEPGASGPTSQ